MPATPRPGTAPSCAPAQHGEPDDGGRKQQPHQERIDHHHAEVAGPPPRSRHLAAPARGKDLPPGQGGQHASKGHKSQKRLVLREHTASSLAPSAALDVDALYGDYLARRTRGQRRARRDVVGNAARVRSEHTSLTDTLGGYKTQPRRHRTNAEPGPRFTGTSSFWLPG
jgi:hypothetical protein